MRGRRRIEPTPTASLSLSLFVILSSHTHTHPSSDNLVGAGRRYLVPDLVLVY